LPFKIPGTAQAAQCARIRGFAAMKDKEERSRVYGGIHFTFDNYCWSIRRVQCRKLRFSEFYENRAATVSRMSQSRLRVQAVLTYLSIIAESKTISSVCQPTTPKD
jgi:hypothetical protein